MIEWINWSPITISDFIKFAGVLLAGAFAYWKFVYQRESEPATDIDIDLKFICIQDGQHIIEITAILKNQSLVRVRYRRFQVSVRYLLESDKIEDSRTKNINYQIQCPRTIDERIGSDRRFFSNVDYLNPKQEFKHRYITFVPQGATVVWVQCRLVLLKGVFATKEVKMNSQRIFAAPTLVA